MSRRIRRNASVASALAIVALLALSGCAAAKGTKPSASPTQAQTPVASAPASPTPSASPTFVPANYDCESILPPATLAVFKSKASAGFTLQSDYVQRIRNFDATLTLFDTYGGILCQWAYPGTSKPIDYGFSDITAANATTVEGTLTGTGYVASQDDNGTLYANPDSTDFPDNYLFFDGHWLYASSRPLLDTIVQNIFQTPGQ